MAQGTTQSDRRTWFETVSTAIVAISALVMVGFYINDRRAQAITDLAERPSPIPDWEGENTLGVKMGPAEAPVVITEFIDFQCPFCAALVPRLDSLISEFPGDVAIVVHHFPLASHPFAAPAAIAVECAHRQGSFEALYRALFTDQKSIGTTAWRDYAERAAVPNLDAFEECIALPADSFPRIAYGRELGARTGVRGTPTIWVNGLPIGRTDLAGLRALVQEAKSE